MTDSIIRNLTELAPCGRCTRPTFREKLPIVTVVQIYQADQSLREAAKNLNIAIASELPIGSLSENFYSTETTLKLQENSGETVLCMRCTVALMCFMEGLTKEEEAEYDTVDQVTR